MIVSATKPGSAAACEQYSRRLDETGFTAFVGARRAALHRWAYLISGDWHQAEDLVQAALIKLYRAWPRITADAAVESYARRILIRTHIDNLRRAWRRLETPTAQLPDNPGHVGLPYDDDSELWEALTALPERQREVLVFRFVLDWSVADTAAALRCSPGTVKSQASRALAQLRRSHGELP